MLKRITLVTLTVLICGFSLTMAALYEPLARETAYQMPDEMRPRYKNPALRKRISLNFSPYYIDGTQPSSPVTEDAVRRLLNAVAPYCDSIRTFSVSGEMEKTYAIAKNDYGMRIIATAWLTGREETDKNELDTLIKLANDGLIDLLLCGSEGIYRGDYNAEYVIQCVNYVKMSLTDKRIPVSTSDTAGTWLDNPSLISYADFVCFTYYPYFDGVAAEKGAEAFEKMYDRLVQTALGKPVICSETGFPDGGETIGRAVPSKENSVAYFNALYVWSQTRQAEVIFFEAADEAWKGAPESAETHWGICDTYGAVKPQYWESLAAIIEREAN